MENDDAYDMIITVNIDYNLGPLEVLEDDRPQLHLTKSVIGDTNSNDSNNKIDITPDDKPLLRLMKSLIGNTKQSTILTNSQIMNILQTELDIDVPYLHELELDIYLNIIKTFLKEWKQWDHFEREIKKLKDQRNLELKKYLKEVVHKASKTMKDTISETIETNKNIDPKLKGDNDVVMEINCSRDHLNQLILRRPTSNNSIFNVDNVIKLNNNLSLESILNWWNVQIEINLSGFAYKREILTPINKKVNKDTVDVTPLNPDWKCKLKKGKRRIHDVDISDIIKMINKIVLHYNKNKKNINIIEDVFKHIFLDFNGIPYVVNLFTYNRRYMSKYSYVRYLYSEPSSDLPLEGNVYDLQLKEVISPKLMFYLTKFDLSKDKFPNNLEWITVKCGLCNDPNTVFKGHEFDSLVKHFSECHSNEPELQCVSCNKKFPMMELAENRWEHNC